MVHILCSYCSCNILLSIRCSVSKSCLTLCNPMDCNTPGFRVLHCLPEIALIHVHWIDDVSISSSSFPSLLHTIFPSIRVFSNELAVHIRWSRYWSFSISPSNDHSGLISFRIDWFDLLAVQGTFKSLLQYHNLKTSFLWCSALFMVQLSQPYTTTGKTIALTRWTFVDLVMSLLKHDQITIC